MTDLTVERHDHVALLEMHRGPANYFDREILAAIADAAVGEAARGVRVLVLASEGRHFCAGADFAATPDGPERAEASRLLYAEAARLFDVPVPMIAAVQGAAIGGGLGLACAADFRVVGPRSRLQANFARLGFHQGFGLSATLPRLVGEQRALDLLYSARTLRGVEAVEWGLADRLAADGAERELALSWAAELAASAPLAVRSMKETMRAPVAAAVRAALERELAEQARLWPTEDSRIGIAASLAGEAPTFVGR